MNSLLLDMDGVLTNFASSILKAHGFDYQTFIHTWPRGHYDMGKLLNLEHREFIAPAKSLEFWSKMEWTHDGEEILDIVRNFYPDKDIYIWTRPSDIDWCLEGKRQWIKRNLPHFDFDNVVFGAAKFLGANPNTVLVDDDENNIHTFLKRKGHGCLVPRKWNSMHQHADHASAQIVENWFNMGKRLAL